jgi:two-component system NtrC family sensor kinase
VLIIGTGVYIPGVEWGLIAKIDTKEAFAPLHQVTWFMLIVVFLGIMLFLLVGNFVSHKITKPIEDLHHGTEIIGEGNLDFKVGTQTKDEIGQLSRAFDQMTEKLKRSTVSLDKLNLEISQRKKVEEQLNVAYEQLKTAQDQLVQSAKMASVGLLAGGVAHEINNPLTGVLNNVQLIKMLAEQKKEFSIDEFKELLNLIEESAQRCSKITRSLLGFSRASKGVLQNCALNEMIEKVIVLIEHELSLENIVIQKSLAPSLPLVKGDPQLLQQVILDIITNAKWAIQKKADKEGGTITIGTEHQSGSNYMSLSISDTGIGIPNKNMERIFEPFFTTKQVGEGTGLGLSIVYSIIKDHSGTITVESQEGKGATFKITLPVAQAQ